jgi:hypothetical protein
MLGSADVERSKRTLWLSLACGAVVLVAIAVIAGWQQDDDRRVFLANCVAARFDAQQCAFLYAIEKRRADRENQDIVNTAITPATGAH